jgi:molybdate transport system permease protein
MIGGNIPDVTRVLSLQIYVYVEMGRYGSAHALSALLVVIAVASMALIQLWNPRGPRLSMTSRRNVPRRKSV